MARVNEKNNEQNLKMRSRGLGARPWVRSKDEWTFTMNSGLVSIEVAIVVIH